MKRVGSILLNPPFGAENLLNEWSNMSRIVYVNGHYVPQEAAKVSIFDRGFLFADGVYEVTLILHGTLIDNEGHLKRLRRSLKELALPSPATDSEIIAIQKELIARNQVQEGVIYLQITRGAAERSFAYPQGVAPTFVMFTQARDVIDIPQAKTGLSILTTPDIRWGRRDIKTVGLLAPCMAQTLAKAAGADDAWMVQEGYVTEGTSHNAYIVTPQNTVVTRPLSREILHGVTRKAILKLTQEAQIAIEERPFRVEEAYAAQEAFITSASTLVLPVIQIDGHPIGDGKPGRIAQHLRQLYIKTALTEIA